MAWSVANIPSQRGRLAVVTGTGGLGYETAVALVRADAEVVLAGRNRAKGTDSVARIVAAVPGAGISFDILDLGNLASIEEFARRLSQRTERVDLLINNAGVMMPAVRQTTSDNFELQFGTNYLGHFALTARLLPLLRQSDAPRVVSVTSQASRSGAVDFNNLQSERSYNAFRAYAQSKLSQLIFATELQRRSDREGWGLLSNAAHPGWAKTDLFQNGPGVKSFSNLINRFIAEPLFAQSAADGALPILYASTSPEAQSGALYGPSGFFEMRGPPHRARIVPSALQSHIASKLWDASETLTRTTFQ